MKLTVPQARLVENRSDEQDKTKVINQVRDVVLNQKGLYYRDITTTDATVTAIWSDTLSANQIVYLELRVSGTDATGTQVAAYERRCAFQRTGTGTVTLVGAGADVIGTDKETVAGWDAGFALDPSFPNTVYAHVIGAAATTITWHAEIGAVWSPFT